MLPGRVWKNLDVLAEKFKDSIKGRKQAVEITLLLEEQAVDYVALLTPLEHPKFADYGKEARQYLAAITNLLRIEQIRPLLLAILRNFEIPKAKLAFELCLSWSVRFLVAGGGGGGVRDRHYGLRAKEVSAGEIKTAKELSRRMEQYIPSDTKFEDSFTRHQVSKAVLARYYLHSLENFKRGKTKPQVGYFEVPESSVNLEHVMADKPCDTWPISLDDAQAYPKRLSNMALRCGQRDSRALHFRDHGSGVDQRTLMPAHFSDLINHGHFLPAIGRVWARKAANLKRGAWWEARLRE